MYKDPHIPLVLDKKAVNNSTTTSHSKQPLREEHTGSKCCVKYLTESYISKTPQLICKVSHPAMFLLKEIMFKPYIIITAELTAMHPPIYPHRFYRYTSDRNAAVLSSHTAFVHQL